MRLVDVRLKTIDALKKADYTRPIKKTLQYLRDEQRDNFTKQGYIYGSNYGFFWPALAEKTRKQRATLGFPRARPILIRTGKLKNGFRITKANSKEGEIVNSVEYAKYHQFGTKWMPKRKIIGATKKEREVIRLIFASHIKGIISGALR